MNQNDLSHIPYSELSKELEKGGKFVCYTYTISVIFMTFRRPSQVYFLKSNEWGIFTSRFNLFYGDRMEYFFTESGSGTDKVSEPAVLEYKEVSMDSVDGRFDAINDCLASRQLHDLTTLRKLMHSYSVEEYVTRQMFEIK